MRGILIIWKWKKCPLANVCKLESSMSPKQREIIWKWSHQFASGKKNLTGKTLQVHLKVNLEPWIGQWYFEIHNFVKTLKVLTNDIHVESHSLLKCLLRWLTVYCPHATMLQPLAVDSVDMTLQLLIQIIWNQIGDKISYLHFYHYYYYFINF